MVWGVASLFPLWGGCGGFWVLESIRLRVDKGFGRIWFVRVAGLGLEPAFRRGLGLGDRVDATKTGARATATL